MSFKTSLGTLALLALASCHKAAAPGPSASLSLSPAAALLKVSQTAQFTASITNLADARVTWRIAEGNVGGTISAAGLYTAPASSGEFHVVAVSLADPGLSATAQVVVRDSTPAVGVWTAVSPSNASLDGALPCGNYGVQTVVVDPVRPSDLYAMFNCQGIWKSTDFGYTWSGPINIGANGAAMAGAGGVTIASASTSSPPVLLVANIRDPGTGFWRSTDGGVSWARFEVAPGGSRQDYYVPATDPYDPKHLLMTGHEMNSLVQSFDGGLTWSAVPTAQGMQQNGGTAFAFMIDTGNPATTRNTFLWMAQQSGGTIGTWRTSDGGASWAQVDKNEHPHGNAQIYQPGNGVVYMAGAYSDLGWGVLRSVDYGQHWSHVGSSGNQSNVFGTPSAVYSMFGWAIGAGQTVDPSLQAAPQPGTGSWSPKPTPAAMTQGPGGVAVTFDGTHRVIVTANYNAGLWLYVEP